MTGTFERVAILNRGEPAMRFIHAAREWNSEGGGAAPLRTIALFTDPDRHAMFVRNADESVYLGPATYLDETDGQRKSSYLDYDRLERALLAARAEAVWVGWGFVAEHADFAELCARLGIVFIGPSPAVMRLLGDKIASKQVAERAGVPVTPWSGGAVGTLVEARRSAERLGFPLLIKAAAGGGGRGIRRVDSIAELDDAFERARSEALRSFGDATVFLERLVPAARHVEVQVIADGAGTVWAVGVRDCSIQRRNQKVIEESPSPVLSPAQDDDLRAAAIRLCTAAGYCNAGTVEFLFDTATQSAAFMEVNTRLQVEHPVTEVTTGLDLVKLQIHIARGGRLTGAPPPHLGHAIEVRLNAEDPDNNFAPAPGSIDMLQLPTGPGLRIDAGVAEGDTVPPDFDSMIAKIIAYGRTRDEALARLRRALADTVVVMRGGTTNKAFLLGLLDRPEVCDGSANTGWLDALTAKGEQSSRRYADVAVLQTAMEVYDEELGLEQRQFFVSASRGRPRVQSEIGHTASLRYRGQEYKLGVFRIGPDDYRIDVDGRRISARIERIGPYKRLLAAGGERYRLLTIAQGLHHLVEVEGVPHRISRDDGGLIRAPSPAVVLSIPVEVGDVVAPGTRLIVLEAMKVEMPVCAPFAGRVREILVVNNVQVDTGTPLVLIDPSDQSDQIAGDRLLFDRFARAPGLEPSLPERRRENLDDLRRLMLGFDIDAAEARRLMADYATLYRDLPLDDEESWRGEEELLTIFTDLRSLFRRQPASDDPDAAEALRTEEYLFSFVRLLDSRGEGLPASFLERVQRALRHYGVTSLDRTPAAQESLLRIFKSQQAIEQRVPVVLGVLQRRLEQAGVARDRVGATFHGLLDQLIAVTHWRFQAICDIACEARYRYFDEQFFNAARARVYREMAEHLAALHRHPDAPDRPERIAALVNCPQPLASVLADRFASADAGLRELMLEVLTRRYYRIRNLGAMRCHTVDGHRCAHAAYDWDEKHVHVVATTSEFAQLGATAQQTRPCVDGVPPQDDVVIDIYTWSSAPLEDADATAQHLEQVFSAVDFGRRVRRIVVVLAGKGVSPGIGGVQHFTFRPTEHGYREEKLHRNLHPMMAKRMHLWRFSNFEIRRLPSVEDVYLFHGVAYANPKDERLFAVAEVRDLTPVRDAAGRIIQFPYVERMLIEAVAGIRRFQEQRAPRDRLGWNRVLLYLWPPLDLRPEEIQRVVRKLAPATEGLGIEQVIVRALIPNPMSGELEDRVLRLSNPTGTGPMLISGPPPEHPLEPLSEYDQKVLRMRQRGLAYPYDIITMLTPARTATQAEFPPGEFTEYDLDDANNLVAVSRPYGKNTANVVVGVIRNFTRKHPEGMTRVILFGDPSKAMGALAEPECRRISAAIDLAGELRVPVEWFPISAGAKISMESGTENMDWIADALRRIVRFTQAGGEINIVVNGINVGAQPYWNAEATMLLHTRGILIMTPQGAMVLTGKQALDYSGSVSAEDNQGIGGYERIMGPNGQAQYWARDITEAAQLLMHHYEHTYVAPGERFPRRAFTTDASDRNVCTAPHGKGDGDGFESVGDIFSEEHNAGRKRPFEIRKVMSAVVDGDRRPMERWVAMRDAEIAVVWDAHLGGIPVCMVGIESRPIPRLGFLPADGPTNWTAGTLFPKSSKKIARAINAASGNRPLVILANLSGFDGSPESMRQLQLEYGAEIGRAVVNFDGPMVFCVVSRYHGGAYVVFSGKLNEHLEIAALEGSYASVIGGAPAAAVVFAGEVEARARRDERIQALEQRIAAAGGAERGRLRAEYDELFKAVHAEKLGQVADEFDHVHSVQRALQVGSLDHIVPPQRLRPYLVDAVERGMRRYLQDVAPMACASLLAAAGVSERG